MPYGLESFPETRWLSTDSLVGVKQLIADVLGLWRLYGVILVQH